MVSCGGSSPGSKPTSNDAKKEAFPDEEIPVYGGTWAPVAVMNAEIGKLVHPEKGKMDPLPDEVACVLVSSLSVLAFAASDG